MRRVNAMQTANAGSEKQKNPFSASGDTAALRLETLDGPVIMEERVRVEVFCSQWPTAIAGISGDCSARVDVQRAPKGQLDALVNYTNTHDLPHATADKTWLQYVLARMEPGRKLPFDPVIPDSVALALIYRQAFDFGLLPQNMHSFVELRSTIDSDWADCALDGGTACKRANPDPQ